MLVIAVIPARGGSLRMPGKNIAPILDKPLIAYTIEKAKAAKRLDRVIVSTDHEVIAKVAERFDAEVIMRPSELATAEAPLDDSLRHVMRYLKTSEGLEVDVVVSLQANNPVRKEGEIDEVVARLHQHTWATSVATAYKVSQRPEWAKRLINNETMEIVPYMSAGENYRHQDLSPLYLLDGSIIAVRASVLEQTAGDRRVHAYLGKRVSILVHDRKFATEIDEPDDMKIAEFYLLENLQGQHRRA